MSATNIVFIDDYEDDQMLFAKAINEIDQTVNCWYALNSDEGLRLASELKETPPDIIFLDLNMPRISGKECLIKLRRMEWLNEVPIIIYTTSDSSFEKLETEKLGATYFLTKRNSFTDLKNDIAFILQTFVQDFATIPRKMSR